jgi:branched-chain amino acid transport system ATP-binding protein
MTELRVANLEVRYGDLIGVADVSLQVAQGTTVALLGSNGAGKSTTLKAIAGLVPASAGQIEWRGESIAHLAAYQIVSRGLALSPEGWSLFTGQTVEQNASARPCCSSGSTPCFRSWPIAAASAPAPSAAASARCWPWAAP